MKRLCLTLSILAFAITVAACQNETIDAGTSTNGPETETITTEPPTPPPAPDATLTESPGAGSDAPQLLEMGTVKEMTQGDIMCYVTLEDETGGSHNLGATFEICAESETYLNKKVKLSYIEATVNDCQSIEPCGKTRQETLISTLEIID